MVKQGRWWHCLQAAHSAMCTAGCTAKRRRIVIQSTTQPSLPPPPTHLPHILVLQNISPQDFQTPPSAPSRKEIPFQRRAPLLYQLRVERIHQDQSWAKLQEAGSLHQTALVGSYTTIKMLKYTLVKEVQTRSCTTPPPTSSPCPGTATTTTVAKKQKVCQVRSSNWVCLTRLFSPTFWRMDGHQEGFPLASQICLHVKDFLVIHASSSDLSFLKYKHATGTEKYFVPPAFTCQILKKRCP